MFSSRREQAEKIQAPFKQRLNINMDTSALSLSLSFSNSLQSIIHSVLHPTHHASNENTQIYHEQTKPTNYLLLLLQHGGRVVHYPKNMFEEADPSHIESGDWEARASLRRWSQYRE